MSKELTPLKAWEEVKDEMLEWTEGYEENFDIIETALEDYERLLKMRKTAEWADEKLQTKKKLKALEIIKEKTVQIADLEECIINEKQDYVEDGLVAYNEWHFEYRQLTLEEYDLLKEVLL